MTWRTWLSAKHVQL